jgi:hypothetical protein
VETGLQRPSYVATALFNGIKRKNPMVALIMADPKLSMKIGTANTICWNLNGLKDYGIDHIYFIEIKLLCFSR